MLYLGVCVSEAIHQICCCSSLRSLRFIDLDRTQNKANTKSHPYKCAFNFRKRKLKERSLQSIISKDQLVGCKYSTMFSLFTFTKRRFLANSNSDVLVDPESNGWSRACSGERLGYISFFVCVVFALSVRMTLNGNLARGTDFNSCIEVNNRGITIMSEIIWLNGEFIV